MDAEYLKLHVGDALAKGLAQVVVNQPNDGVDFLGNFLIKYAETKEKEEADVARAANQKAADEARAAKEAAEAKVAEEKAAEAAAKDASDADLKAALQSAVENEGIAYPASGALDDATGDNVAGGIDALLSRTCEHIKQRTGATSVYIGKLTTAPEGAENAGAQYVRYVSASSDNAFLVGKSLLAPEDPDAEEPVPESGVTFEVFKPVEEEEEPEEDEENAGGPKVPKPPRTVHVKNVLRDSRVKFFKFPKLGAFAAVVVNYSNSMISVNEEHLAEEDGGDADAAEAGGDAAAEGGEGKEQAAAAARRVWQVEEPSAEMMVIGIDSMGQGREFTEAELAFVQDVSKDLGVAMTALSNHQYQAEVAVQRQHAKANAALAEALAAKAEERAAQQEEAMAKLAEDAPEDEKKVAETDFKAQAARSDLIESRQHIERLLRFQIAPPAAVVEAMRACFSLVGVNVECTDPDTKQTSWAAFKSADLDAVFAAVEGVTADFFGDADAIAKSRESADAIDADGAAAYSSAVGSLVAFVKASLDWSEATAEAAAAAAERAAAEAEAAAAAAEAEAGGEEEAPADE
eukprot:g831.t1